MVRQLANNTFRFFFSTAWQRRHAPCIWPTLSFVEMKQPPRCATSLSTLKQSHCHDTSPPWSSHYAAPLLALKMMQPLRCATYLSTMKLHCLSLIMKQPLCCATFPLQWSSRYDAPLFPPRRSSNYAAPFVSKDPQPTWKCDVKHTIWALYNILACLSKRSVSQLRHIPWPLVFTANPPFDKRFSPTCYYESI